MRGGAQAHLLGCDDGSYYVVKFRENPQHRRILINEWLAATFLDFLRVAAPVVRPVEVRAEFLESEPHIRLQLGQREIPIVPGRHFGSRFPGHPDRDAVYDYLPDSLMPQTTNLRDFWGVLVFDKWAGNADSRQAVFCRRRLRDMLGSKAGQGTKKGFVALMVDHGFILEGPHWNLSRAPLQGLYFRPIVYQELRSMDDFEPWLSLVRSMPEEIFDRALRSVPQEWLDGDLPQLEAVLERLYQRREIAADLVRESISARPGHFPKWQG